MSKENTLPSYQSIDALLQQHTVPLTAAEMHGLITGFICGAVRDSSWKTLLHDLTNEGLAFPKTLLDPLEALYHVTYEQLDDSVFNFSMLLPAESDSIFLRADALAGWVNHFLLGLGVAQPKLSEHKELLEVITDLRNIGALGYEEDENQEELEDALEEVTEYVKVSVQLCYITFVAPKGKESDEQDEQRILH
ncbi:YecA family protein [Proteus hauseri]|uniref:YecA/YgfB family protein n=1 Tax=Proteus hauseri TaxID=183417 RepID=UPI0032DBDC7A